MEKKKINEKDLHLNPEYSGEEAAKAGAEKGSPLAGEASVDYRCPITGEDGCEATLNGCNTRVCLQKPSVDVCQLTEGSCAQSFDVCPNTDSCIQSKDIVCAISKDEEC